MKVTNIRQQTRHTDRYSVYIDEKYTFSLNDYQLAASGLRVGKTLTVDEVDNFAKESQFGRAYERTLSYVMIRPRSEKEIRDYLTRTFLYPKPKSYTDKNGQRHFKKQTIDTKQVTQVIERVMERLAAKGYINDEAFATSWAASRQAHKKPSRRKLEQELRAKGVPADIIATVLQKVPINETDNLAELVAKKRRLSRYQDDTKLTQYLLRQGFSYDDIREVLAHS